MCGETAVICGQSGYVVVTPVSQVDVGSPGDTADRGQVAKRDILDGSRDGAQKAEADVARRINWTCPLTSWSRSLGMIGCLTDSRRVDSGQVQRLTANACATRGGPSRAPCFPREQ